LKTQGRFSKRPISQQRLPLPFDVESFLRTLRSKTKVIEFSEKDNIFVQGEPAGAVFYVQKGRVKLTVISEQGKAAIIGVLNDGNFFGEGCMAGQALRMMTASAITDCTLLRIEKPAMVAALHERHDFSEFFIAYVLSRNIRYEADLTIPQAVVGLKNLTAFGVTGPEQVITSAPVQVDVEPSAQVTTLASSLQQIQFGFTGDQFPLSVKATFADGSQLNVTRSTQLLFSSGDAKVATVDSTGLVTATGAGTTTVGAT